jgi:hypothetical protein
MEAVTGSGQASPRLVAVSDSTGRDPACLLPVAIGVDDVDTPEDEDLDQALDDLMARYLSTSAAR